MVAQSSLESLTTSPWRNTLSEKYYDTLVTSLTEINQRLEDLQNGLQANSKSVPELIVINVCTPAFNALRVLAEGAVSESDGTLSDKPAESKPGHLTDPTWDQLFQGFKDTLGSGVNVLLDRDLRKRGLGSGVPALDSWYNIMTTLIPKLTTKPVLASYAKELLRRLQDSRTGNREWTALLEAQKQEIQEIAEEGTVSKKQKASHPVDSTRSYTADDYLVNKKPIPVTKDFYQYEYSDFPKDAERWEKRPEGKAGIVLSE